MAVQPLMLPVLCSAFTAFAVSFLVLRRFTLTAVLTTLTIAALALAAPIMTIERPMPPLVLMAIARTSILRITTGTITVTLAVTITAAGAGLKLRAQTRAFGFVLGAAQTSS